MEGTVLITGGTSGIGYQAALHIAQQHPELRVIVASRSDRDSSAEAINKITGNSNATYLQLDLGSLENVRSFSTTYAKKDFPPIRALFLNAALQFPGEVSYSEDGFEKTFAISHVGHALLFHLLTPFLAPDARITITSSGTHDPATKSGMPDAVYRNAEELAHPTAETAKYPGRQRYTSVKLVNIMWMHALNRRLAAGNVEKKRNWTVVAVEPGLVPGTGLARDSSGIERLLWVNVLPRLLWLLRLLLPFNVFTAEEAGGALAEVGIRSKTQGKSGVYFESLKEATSSEASYKETEQEELWQWTVKNISKSEEEVNRFNDV